MQDTTIIFVFVIYDTWDQIEIIWLQENIRHSKKPVFR